MTKPSISQFVEIPATKNSIANRKLIYNVAINDADYLTKPIINNKIVGCPYYTVWSNMLQRSYSDNYKSNNPSYNGCTVCEDWLTFSTFKSWMKKQDWKGKSLDKDILVLGNKIYSPEACIFVEQYINTLLTFNKSNKGKYTPGVNYCKQSNKFEARCRTDNGRIRLGLFNTPEEATSAYNTFKKQHIIDIANIQSDNKLKAGLLRHAEVL